VTRTPNPCTQRRSLGACGETAELQGRLRWIVVAEWSRQVALEDRLRERERAIRKNEESLREWRWREKRLQDAKDLLWHGWDADGAPVYGPPPNPRRGTLMVPALSRARVPVRFLSAGPAMVALLPLMLFGGVHR